MYSGGKSGFSLLVTRPGEGLFCFYRVHYNFSYMIGITHDNNFFYLA
jgi:hypothetical protein